MPSTAPGLLILSRSLFYLLFCSLSFRCDMRADGFWSNVRHADYRRPSACMGFYIATNSPAAGLQKPAGRHLSEVSQLSLLAHCYPVQQRRYDRDINLGCIYMSRNSRQITWTAQCLRVTISSKRVFYNDIPGTRLEQSYIRMVTFCHSHAFSLR